MIAQFQDDNNISRGKLKRFTKIYSPEMKSKPIQFRMGKTEITTACTKQQRISIHERSTYRSSFGNRKEENESLRRRLSMNIDLEMSYERTN